MELEAFSYVPWWVWCFLFAASYTGLTMWWDDRKRNRTR